MPKDDELTAVIARFPARLKELRTRAALTQSELSKRSGVPQPTIAQYEKGANAPTWGAVVRLARSLGVATDAFQVAPANPESLNPDAN